MDVLIVTGSSVAYFFQSWRDLRPDPEPPMCIMKTGAAIITLIRLGKFLESRAKGKASEALKALMGLRARTARVFRDGVEVETDIDRVVVGDVVVVRPGEKVPVDGILVDGRSAIDESMITGESMPVNKEPGDEAIGGDAQQGRAVKKSRPLKSGGTVCLPQIVRMVQEAQAGKAPIQKLTDQIGQYFCACCHCDGVVHICRLVMGCAHRLARGHDETPWRCWLSHALVRWAWQRRRRLWWAWPKGAGNGILFKNSETLQRAGQVNIVALDKTGTITRGEPDVTDIVPIPGWNTDEVLRPGRQCRTRIRTSPGPRHCEGWSGERFEPYRAISIPGFQWIWNRRHSGGEKSRYR